MTAKFLRIFAVLILLATLAFWTLSGANFSHTKSVVPTAKGDAMASYLAARQGFHPGIEFLAGNVGLAVVLFTISFFVGKKNDR